MRIAEYARAATMAGIVVGCGGGQAFRDAAEPDVQAEPDASATLAPLFRFAVVGDTRPANVDDVPGYPTAVITQIWADVEASAPHPDFALSTGDYVDANPSTHPSTVNAQLDAYLGARAQFHNAVFAAMGNHECTGDVPSNCGSGASDGFTANYIEFMRRMVVPHGISTPYYVVHFAASDGSWTTKLVFIAANAWNATQAAWLDQALAEPTTYTFVLRHEGAAVIHAPGVPPSEPIIASHPLPLKIVGHDHTYSHLDGEVTIGNGGAPLSSSVDYGYAIVERLATGAIQLTAYDYRSGAAIDQFRVNADGTPAP